MSGTDDQMWPAQPSDVADDNPKMVSNHLRALQNEVRSGFELITTKLLTSLDRLTNKLDDFSARFDEHEKRTDRRFAEVESRLAALETKGRKPRKK